MALTGTEILQVLGVQSNGKPAATTEQTTTGAIAALASTESAPFISTSITTVGNGTLTAAGLVGGQIVRTGPVAAFTDTTDTAAAIVAAGALPSSSFSALIKNATAFTQTLQAGTGITLSATVIIPAFSVANYVVNVNTATTATFIHIDTTPISIGANLTAPSATALSTVGAGTILAAAFVGGLISRTGSQSGTAFTDTTDIATAIIAACANLVNKIGASMLVEYSNTTNATATLQGGTGVTVSGVSVIPPNTVGQFLLTYTTAATMTLVGVGVTQNIATSLTVLGSSTGSTAISTANAGTTNNTATLPNVTGVIASTSGANLFVTDVYRSSASVTANATVTPQTITGLAGAVAIGTYRFRAVLPSTVASGTGGIAYNFLLTTAVLSSIQYGATMQTASALQYTQGTTAASGTVVATEAAVVLQTIIEGTFVVSTAGTFTLQMAQNTSNASNSITLIGSTLELCRIA